MTWTTFHHRGEVLRTVTQTADARRDGILPMDVDGVSETFRDELTLLGALQLRWHTRLSGRIERELLNQPMDLDRAVIAAWHATADELSGIRAIVDHYRDEPTDDAMASAMTKSAGKEWVLLAAMAGRAGAVADDTAEAGRLLENQARETHQPATRPASVEPHHNGLLSRLKAVVAA
jgi:hypothetical protein